jgi:hypothetical protein
MLLAPIDSRSSATIVAGSQVAGSPGTRNPLARLWNRFIACPTMTTEDQESRPASDGVVDRPRERRSTSWAGKLLVGSFCVLGVLELAILQSSSGSAIKPEEISVAFDETSLPAEMADWQRLQFTTELRDRSSDEGECSQIWKYRAGNVIAHVSMDYPFVGWHELTSCYEGRGWHVESRESRPADIEHKTAGDYVEVEMSLPTGDRGLLLFSLFDGQGRPLKPGESHGERLVTKITSHPLASWFGLGGSSASPDVISIQVQQLLQMQGRPTAEERAQAIATFLEFRERLRQNWLAHRGE